MNSIFSKKELLSLSNLKKEDLDFSGNGKRKLLIVINHTENGNKPKEFLSKILKAKKIEMIEDTFLLSINPKDHLSLSQIKKGKEIEQLLFFGTNPKQLGLNLSLKKYKTESINGLTIMCADGISEIEENEPLKRQLWNCLKDWPMES